MKTEIWKSRSKPPNPEKYYELPREVLALLHEKVSNGAKLVVAVDGDQVEIRAVGGIDGPRRSRIGLRPAKP
ncbi:MAG TPA: hypothetical protein VMT61_02575 [Candidatus Binataceae bacterium]|nr:hypothetical protein [Candidatus Binataceae bacterium]